MKKIFETKTAYSTYAIVDQTYNDRPARVLYAGRSTPQSGLALDDRPELLFDYVQRLFEIVLSVRPRRVLVIGGGAFVLPKALIERTAVARVDVVEIDPQLPQLARDYFGLPDDVRLRVVSGDAVPFIAEARSRYDLIVIDAFLEYDIPGGLLDSIAASHYERLLSPTGLLALNFIGYYRGKRSVSTRLLAETFRVIGSTVIFPADVHDDETDEQNLLLIGSKNQLPELPYLQSTPVEVTA